jgi:hypothetical protein
MIEVHNAGDKVWWIGIRNGYDVPAMDTVQEVHINESRIMYTLEDYGTIGSTAVFGTKNEAEEYCVGEFIKSINEDEEFKDMLDRHGIVLDSKQSANKDM